MERYCGMLQGSLRSRSQPWGNLNKRVLQLAYLAQLNAKYDLEEELAVIDIHTVTNTLSRYECNYVNCKFLFM
jgi:hypothetical protein